MSPPRPSVRYSDRPVSAGTRLSGFGCTTLIALLIVAGTLFSWHTRTAPPAAPTLIAFDVTAPAAPLEPPGELPPKRQPVRVERSQPAPDPPQVKSSRTPLPGVNLAPLPVARPDPDPPTEPATTPQVAPARPLAVASDAAPTWQGRVLAALSRARRYPRSAQRFRQQGVPYIRVVMDREGRVLSSRLERSSGFRTLDDEAVSLARRASPLPKPPDEVPGAMIELVVPVEYYLQG